MPPSVDELSAVQPEGDPLDELLGEAFRSPGESVELERPQVATLVRGRLPLRLLDRESAAGDQVPDQSGHFEVRGELGRGGMGIVLDAQDLSLGRAVAIKLLAEESLSDAGRVQRFLEEAQITGQLEHPGIAPVHELALAEDGRPFFVMKRIEGETLADLLRRRSDPTVERRRFLGIFEQVCQTVGYAHARGVIHRDLKPANVMVGAFGEVLVIDWGLAKILRQHDDHDQSRASGELRTVRSDDPESISLDGTVAGTPRYMAPEQARGSAVDQRSDVFALGRILCEILAGTTAPAAAVEAAGARQAAADLLASRAIEDELAALVLRALEVDPARRFPDAGKVAVAIGQYLERVEERARAAALTAAEERARSAEAIDRLRAERRARRLSFVLLSVLLVAATASAVGIPLWQRKQQERVQRANRDVLDATYRAGQLLQDARGSPAQDSGPWTLAIAAAEQALALASNTPADAAAHTRAKQLLDSARREADGAAEAARRTAADLAMVEELDRIQAGLITHWDFARLSEEYARAFAAYGIEVDHLGPQDAVDLIVASAIASQLVLALHDWSGARSVATGPKSAGELLDIARRAEPEPFRDRVMELALQPGGLTALQQLADAETIDRESDDALKILGERLFVQGDLRRAIRLYRLVQQRSPGDFWANFQLGYYVSLLDPPSYEEMARFSGAALAINQRSAPAWSNLSLALSKTAQPVDGLYAADRALELAPQLVPAHVHRAIALRGMNRYEDAELAYWDALDLDPNNPQIYRNLANVLLDQGDPDGAVDAVRTARDLDPKDATTLRKLAFVLRERGRRLAPLDPRAAQIDLAEALELEPDSAETTVALARAARRLGEFKEALELLLRARALAQRNSIDDYPSAGLLEEYKRRAQVADRPLEFESGGVTAEDAGELLLVAEVCLASGQLLAATRCYEKALASEPRFERWPILYDATRAAVGASTQTTDQSAARELRRSALDWLNEALEGLRSALDRPTKTIGWADRYLEHLAADPDLDAVRDPQSLLRLPPAERADWEAFWRDVETARGR